MNEINVAIIGGAGFMGKAHSLAWALAAAQAPVGTKINKRVLVEVDPDIAERTAVELGWQEASTDWQSVIDRTDVHVVDIVTPPHTHASIARYAIARGKHVLSEKPLTSSMDEDNELVNAAKSSSVVTQVGYNYRHNGAIRLAKQLISEGRLGRILQVRFQYHQDCAFGPMGWRAHKATGGSGASSDIGSHIVDLAAYLVGRITGVAAALQNIQLNGDDDHDVDDGGLFLAKFGDGPLGVFSFSQKSWGRNNQIRFEIDGTDGALAFDWNRRDELEVYVKDQENPLQVKGFTTVHIDGHTPGTWFDLNGVGTGYLESSANQLITFVDAISNGTSNSPTFEEGAYVQRVIDRVWSSAADEGRWTSV